VPDGAAALAGRSLRSRLGSSGQELLEHFGPEIRQSDLDGANLIADGGEFHANGLEPIVDGPKPGVYSLKADFHPILQPVHPMLQAMVGIHEHDQGWDGNRDEELQVRHWLYFT
jgi:hypothetical protein